MNKPHVKKPHLIELPRISDRISFIYWMKEICRKKFLHWQVFPGISKKTLREEGQDAKEVLSEFIKIIGDLPLVGYNLKFDVDFINHYLEKHGMQARRRLTSLWDLW